MSELGRGLCTMVDGAEEYVVERVLNKRVSNAGKKSITWYEVKWEGYGPEDNTWEPADALENCKDLIDAYEKRIASKDQQQVAKRKEKASHPESREGKKRKVPIHVELSKRFRNHEFLPIPLPDNLKIVEIKGGTSIDGELFLKCRWVKLDQAKPHDDKSDAGTSLVPAMEVRERNPMLLIDFYESKLEFLCPL